MIAPELTTAAGERYVDGGYLAENPDWHADDAPWKAGHILRMLERAKLKPKTVCEVGCGSGRVIELVAEGASADQADGYDISPQALTIASQRTRDGLSFYSGSPFDGDRRYDLAMAIDVIEHVEDPFAFARGLGKIGRYQLLHIPLDMNALSVARGWVIMDARNTIGHIHYFTRDTALALLDEAGLELIDEAYTPWAIDQSYKSWKKRIAAIPRRIAFGMVPHGTVRTIGGWSLLVLTRVRDEKEQVR
ncbi:hypothetical protein BH09PSE3_BH09PSE3_03940 [soil metagenome]